MGLLLVALIDCLLLAVEKKWHFLQLFSIYVFILSEHFCYVTRCPDKALWKWNLPDWLSNWYNCTMKMLILKTAVNYQFFPVMIIIHQGSKWCKKHKSEHISFKNCNFFLSIYFSKDTSCQIIFHLYQMKDVPSLTLK